MFNAYAVLVAYGAGGMGGFLFGVRHGSPAQPDIRSAIVRATMGAIAIGMGLVVTVDLAGATLLDSDAVGPMILTALAFMAGHGIARQRRAAHEEAGNMAHEVVTAAIVAGGMIAGAMLWNGNADRQEARARLRAETDERRCDRLAHTLPTDFRQALAAGAPGHAKFWEMVSRYEGLAHTSLASCSDGSVLTPEQREKLLEALMARMRGG